MSHTNNSRGVLVGLGVVAGAFAVAAALSGVAAPAARADDFTTLLGDVADEYSGGQLAFEAAASDFAGGTATDEANGFMQLIDGVDDDSVLPTFQILVGGAQLLQGDSLTFFSPFVAGAPIPDLTTGLTDASDAFQQGLGAFADIATALGSANYIDALEFAIDGSYLTTVAAPEEILEGAFDQAVGFTPVI
jgi:hypothetical protein